MSEVVMGDVYPLQLLWVLHDSFETVVQARQFSKFVVTQHERHADQLHLDELLLLFLELLFSLK